ncbi:lysophospholipid acyltransferase family protein [Murinocardiopsis flavida]|nr:lysophospholipid acyltransferase family protein [Murinocardiopsis flavida]
MIGARVRRALWRAVLRSTGGFRVEGGIPDGPCVVVANHSSHADTVALLAALPARSRPKAAAAADYWFGAPLREWAGRSLVGVFPVRRGGGGSADLLSAADLLGAGHAVIVYPEGTRSRDGAVGRFHSGAARLAAQAGVPLVPAAITGTRTLLPVGGGLRRSPVAVRFGTPADGIEQSRRQITAALGTAAGRGRRDVRHHSGPHPAGAEPAPRHAPPRRARVPAQAKTAIPTSTPTHG